MDFRKIGTLSMVKKYTKHVKIASARDFDVCSALVFEVTFISNFNKRFFLQVISNICGLLENIKKSLLSTGKAGEMTKRICIVGAGASGLTAIKACLEQNLEPVCYEWTNHVGGLWRYREEDVHGLGSVMRSTIINSSKELSAFSDFPPPTEYPNYMHNSKMIKYIEMYAKNFDLVRYVRFEHEVKDIVKADDYDETGRWRVKVQKVGETQATEDTFDGVMVCAGHHVFPIIPEFPGQDKFKGRIIHTHSYKKPNGYDDKKVLVVGVGNSGGDVAVELSNIASQVRIDDIHSLFYTYREIGSNCT